MLAFQVQGLPNEALKLTANPLCGLSAAELGRQAAFQSFGRMATISL